MHWEVESYSESSNLVSTGALDLSRPRPGAGEGFKLTELCEVCSDKASGRHYGVTSCEGCKGFFRRTTKKQITYHCKGGQACDVSKRNRNGCPACRFKKCLSVGMMSGCCKKLTVRLPANPEETKVMNTSLTYTYEVLDDIPAQEHWEDEQSEEDKSKENMIEEDMIGEERSKEDMIVEDLIEEDMIEEDVIEEDKSGEDKNKEDKSDKTILDNVLKLKPLHKLQSKKETAVLETKPPEIVLNTNYTYETSVEENDNIKQSEVTGNEFEEKSIDTSSSSKQNKSSLLNGKSHVPDHQIFDPSIINFDILKPQRNSNPPDGQLLYEMSSRVIFQCISWATLIPVFRSMTYQNQVDLLRSSWANLFIIGLAQCKNKINLSNLLEIITSNLQNCVIQQTVSLSKLRHLTNTLAKFKAITNKIEAMDLNKIEFAYLRLGSIFRTDQHSQSLKHLTEKISERVISSFQASQKDKPERFTNLLNQLSSLKSLQPNLLKELFFSGLIGNVPIDSVIPYILSMQLKGGKKGQDKQ